MAILAPPFQAGIKIDRSSNAIPKKLYINTLISTFYGEPREPPGRRLIQNKKLALKRKVQYGCS
jgi:hypothetical protein